MSTSLAAGIICLPSTTAAGLVERRLRLCTDYKEPNQITTKKLKCIYTSLSLVSVSLSPATKYIELFG